VLVLFLWKYDFINVKVIACSVEGDRTDVVGTKSSDAGDRD